MQQRESLNRAYQMDLLRADREKDEDHRRLIHQARLTEEKLKAEIRRETTR